MKKENIKKEQDVVIYQGKDGAIELRGDIKKETIWASQAEMARIFGVTTQNITIHLKNIYSDGELLKNSTCKKSLQVQTEGGRSIRRNLELYNLDAIISVGYRVNSKTGTKFRIWATKTLKKYITQGYAINPNQITKNYNQFIKAVEETRKLLPAENIIPTESVLELIKFFASTWLSLDSYDRSTLPSTGVTKRQATLTADELGSAIFEIKKELVRKKEATELFATERGRDGVAGIVGDVLQSFGGADVYPTIEEKAAHLLYFMVKNHPFIDGNKRSGAFSFVWFLKKTGLLDLNRITPEALTALTLLVAESAPKEKDRVVGLVLAMLKK